MDRRAEQHEEQGRHEGQERAQTGLALQHPQQQGRHRHVNAQQRELQDGDGGAEEQEQGGGQPGLDGQHEVLPIEEDGQRPELAEVLRHQADDGLIGVELRGPAEHQRAAAEEHQRDGKEGDQRALARPTHRSPGRSCRPPRRPVNVIRRRRARLTPAGAVARRRATPG